MKHTDVLSLYIIKLEKGLLADELTKFAKLREQGVMTSEEFERVKKDLLEGKR